MLDNQPQFRKQDLQKFKPSNRRWRRVLQHPYRALWVSILRRTRTLKEIVVQSPFGFKFSGVLPEHVSALIWRFGVYEWSTTILLARVLRSGDGFVDIGSHFGYFTLLSARLVGDTGKVFAIEAMPETYQRLQRNISLNRLENVQAFNMAAHGRSERLTFRDFGLISSSLNTSGVARGALFGRDAPAREVVVQAERFDTLIPRESWPSIRAVKIDAESSEETVLEGMSGFFAAGSRPMLLIELGGGGLPEAIRARAIAALLGEYDYRGYTFDGAVLSPVRIDDDLPYMNAFFIAGPDGPARLGLSLSAGA
jgi:FkbM family methyltransferase